MTSGPADPVVIRRHLAALREALGELRKRPAPDAQALQVDVALRWAVERGLQLCAQNVLDIAAHVAAASGRDAPDYRTGIERLRELGIVPAGLAERLKPLAGLRNVLVHGYLEVDLRILARILARDLGDLDIFVEHIERYRRGIG